MKSKKTQVIEYIFRKLWDDNAGKLRRTVVTFDDVTSAIDAIGSNLSKNNPANFIKDFLRGGSSSSNWPACITEKRITARQLTGDRKVFEFIDFAPNQTEPFPDLLTPDSATPAVKVQAISLPLAARELGRNDEAWLVQSLVNLKIIEAHFAISSPTEIMDISHLQMSVKLKGSEIDALFLAQFRDGQNRKHALVTCEAKQKKDPILIDQIVRQVQAAFKAAKDCEFVIPLAAKALGSGSIFIIEFGRIARQESASLKSLEMISSAIYELTPPLKGI